MSDDIRVLLLADSHLGFDLPVSPRVARRRRGHDFLANYATALEPALTGEVDIVVHAGDVFDRPSIAPSVAYQALEPLRRIADRGVPVFIVPGNHERSRLPHARFAAHPCVNVFDRPRTFVAEVRGRKIAIAGFPYERRDVRARFAGLVQETACRRESTALRLLCMHHCFEGATVGPADYTFTTAADVVRARDVSSQFAAVLSGHIHRHQVLTTDLAGRPLAAPVLYPGSIERTSIAETDEPKGFVIVRVSQASVRWEFRRLPARPMIRRDVAAGGMSPASLESAVRAIIDCAPPDAVVSIRVDGPLTDEQWRMVSAARLRRFVPETMNVDVRPTLVRVTANASESRVRRSSSRERNGVSQTRTPLGGMAMVDHT
jgi:DNA repair exonuclease SbcCD nuclease subunit